MCPGALLEGRPGWRPGKGLLPRVRVGKGRLPLVMAAQGRLPPRHGRAQSRPSALRRFRVDGRDTRGHDGEVTVQLPPLSISPTPTDCVLAISLRSARDPVFASLDMDGDLLRHQWRIMRDMVAIAH